MIETSDALDFSDGWTRTPSPATTSLRGYILLLSLRTPLAVARCCFVLSGSSYIRRATVPVATATHLTVETPELVSADGG